MPRMLDLITMVQRGELPHPPIATLIGFTIGSIEPGRVVMEMDAGPQHANPMGTLLTATGRLVKGGHTVGLVECDVHDDKDRLVARASSTCMTLRGAQAEGRWA